MSEPVVPDGKYYRKVRSDVFDDGWAVESRIVDGGEECQECVAHLDTEGLADALLAAVAGLIVYRGEPLVEGRWYAAR